MYDVSVLYYVNNVTLLSSYVATSNITDLLTNSRQSLNIQYHLNRCQFQHGYAFKMYHTWRIAANKVILLSQFCCHIKYYRLPNQSQAKPKYLVTFTIWTGADFNMKMHLKCTVHDLSLSTRLSICPGFELYNYLC